MDFEPPLRSIAKSHDETLQAYRAFKEKAKETAEKVYDIWDVAGYRPVEGLSGKSEDDVFHEELGTVAAYLRLAFHSGSVGVYAASGICDETDMTQAIEQLAAEAKRESAAPF